MEPRCSDRPGTGHAALGLAALLLAAPLSAIDRAIVVRPGCSLDLNTDSARPSGCLSREQFCGGDAYRGLILAWRAVEPQACGGASVPEGCGDYDQRIDILLLVDGSSELEDGGLPAALAAASRSRPVAGTARNRDASVHGRTLYVSTAAYSNARSDDDWVRQVQEAACGLSRTQGDAPPHARSPVSLPPADIIRERAAAAGFPHEVSRSTPEVAALRESVSAPRVWGWTYQRTNSSGETASIRVDFTFNENRRNYSLIGRIYERLSDPRVAESIRAQLATLAAGGSAGPDPYFDPELALLVPAQETRGGLVFSLRGGLSGDNNTFNQGGCDDCGSLVEDYNGQYLPADSTRSWRVVRMRTDEHRDRDIRALTEVSYREHVALYGAYLRALQVRYVIPALGDDSADVLADDRAGRDTLRLITRAAFSGVGHMREILRHLRTVASRSADVRITDVIGDPSLRQELLELIPRRSLSDLHSKPLRRALITVAEARHLEEARVLRDDGR